MPLYDYKCRDCDAAVEVFLGGRAEQPKCPKCGSVNLHKLISAPSSFSGSSRGLPGPGDTACCGSSPGQAGCAGPGSCCGKSV